MQDVSAEIVEKNGQEERTGRKSSEENIALQRCYGQIGISAVAAAARYQRLQEPGLRPGRGRVGQSG